MNRNRRMIASILEIALGIALWIANRVGMLDSFWSGMGTALIVVGAVFLVRQIRYHTNEDYRENVDVQTNDERNKYIAMTAWAWAGYTFVLITAVGTIVLKLLGHDVLMQMAAGSLCLIVVLYWISFMILRKKY